MPEADMGQYKVPQNVEAEDKILGPLSLKQFIYAVIGVGYGFLTFAIFQKIILIWILVGLPPMLFLLALGLYQREDQPLETYFVAVLQFFTRPRHRLWEKEPIAEVFHLQPPPPKPEEHRRDPNEVRSQLDRLADLVDSRGWSVKEETAQPGPGGAESAQVIDLADRLGGASISAQAASNTSEASTAEDILDASNQNAQNLNVLIENSVKSLREEAMAKMRATAGAPSPKPGATVSAPAVVAVPQPHELPPPVKPAASAPTAPKSEIVNQKAAKTAPHTKSTPRVATSEHRASSEKRSETQSVTGMTPENSTDILKVASEGEGLTVAQIAAQAKRLQQQLAEGQTVNVRTNS
jgi:hypothetical protein